MRRLILCRERFEYLHRSMKRNGGRASLRDLWRTFGIYGWEVEQAAEAGLIRLFIHRPPGRGRPSRVAEFCGYTNAKLPKPRAEIERGISIRHQVFAMRSAYQCCPRGIRYLGVPGVVVAYFAVYRCKSRNAAHASASRLMRRRDVRAMRQWYFAKLEGAVSKGELPPETVSEIRERLRAAGSWRAKTF